MKLTYADLAMIVEGLYYGGQAENIETTEELIEYLNENSASSVTVHVMGGNEIE